MCDRFIEIQPEYDHILHERNTSFRRQSYHTICSIVRNHIDHPDNPNNFTQHEMELSVELMISILKRIKGIL